MSFRVISWCSTRESTYETRRLELVWVQVWVQESTNDPFLGVLSAVAKQQRTTISGCAKVGIARGRRQGVEIVQPQSTTPTIMIF